MPRPQLALPARLASDIPTTLEPAPGRRPRLRVPRRLRESRRTLVVAAAALLAVAVLASGAAAVYDHQTSDRLLPETVIGDVGVGGLHVRTASDRLTERYEDPLHLPLQVSAPGLETMTTPWDLGMRVGIDAAVRRALAEGRKGAMPARVWRRLFGGGDRKVLLEPKLTEPALKAFLSDASERVQREAVDATLSVSGGWGPTTPSRPGRALDLGAARRDLERVIALGPALERSPQLELATREVQPKVPSSAFATIVLVRLGENKLYLYENGQITRTYDVATGAPGFETPTGKFKIVNKRVNPRWVNPGSDWAKRMPHSIPPGPDNPLGSRAMDLNTSGIRIHGTPDAASIGYSASHGCIRMHMAQAEDLFGRVAVGTPVVIVNAAAAKPRPSKTAKPAASAPPA